MPNDQDPPNPNPANNQIPGNNPPPTPSEDVPFPVNDLPPLTDTVMPIESQVMANAPQTPGNPPPFDIPPVVTPLTKKGWSGGKIVGAVLGLLLLVGGIGAGILLVQQQQDIRKDASTAPGCTAVGGPTAQCYPSDTSCTGTNYGAVDCGTGRKCATNCTTPPPASTACQPGQERTENCIVDIGAVPGSRRSVCSEAGSWGAWSACAPGGNIPSPTASTSTANTCATNGGSCFSAAGGCVSIGRSTVNGVCTGGQVCCSTAVGGSTPTPTPGGGSTPTPTPTPNSSAGCRYVNDENTVSLAGNNCDQYTFRALVFTCNGPLVGGKCEGSGSTITQDTPNARSVSIGSASCGSKQADLIVTSRPNDGLSGDELPGTPRVANFIARNFGSGSCGGGGTPTPTPAASVGTLSASCDAGIRGTGIPAGINTVHLYFDSGPEDYTSSGGSGKAAAKQVTVTNGTFNYSLKTAANLLIPKEVGGNVNLGDGAAHRIRAFAINFSSNPELNGSGLSLNLTGSSCIGGTGTPVGPTCQQVLAYDTNWNQLNATQLSNLRTGDKVRFTISGTRSTGTFTKARFKINQNAAVEVTGKKPGQTEVFFYEYTIPAGVTTFQINAAIYLDPRGWIPAIIN